MSMLKKYRKQGTLALSVLVVLISFLVALATQNSYGIAPNAAGVAILFGIILLSAGGAALLMIIDIEPNNMDSFLKRFYSIFVVLVVVAWFTPFAEMIANWLPLNVTL